MTWDQSNKNRIVNQNFEANQPQNLPRSVLKAEKLIRDVFPTLYRRFSGYRNSKCTEVFQKLEFACKIDGISFRRVYPTFEKFLGCNIDFEVEN